MKRIYIFFLLLSCCMPATMYAQNHTQEKQQQLFQELLQKQHVFEMRIYILVGIVVILVLLFGLLCFFNKRSDTRLQNIMQLLKNQQKSTEQTTNKDEQTLAIDPTLVCTILHELQAFEKERGFLMSKITLHAFAKQLQTNTKYLSKIINTYKLKSFRNYINDLRIQYSIEQLQNDNDYRNYTVKVMAEKAGFTTVNSFSKAFQKRTGTTVSGFLKQS